MSISLQYLENEYATRTQHLLEKSAQHLKDWEDSVNKKREAQEDILKTIIDYALTPTSHMKLFGVDMVLFNGKGKQTILRRTTFDLIEGKWKSALAFAGIEKCVLSHRQSTPFSAYDVKVVKLACEKCLPCRGSCVLPEQ